MIIVCAEFFKLNDARDMGSYTFSLTHRNSNCFQVMTFPSFFILK